MKESIETIWKEGFLDTDAMVVPKLNNLYTQKSIHIVDQFKRMFRMNLYAILIFSFVVLIASFILDIKVMGISMFLIFNCILLVNKRFYKSLNEIDINANSYEYLKSFDTWLQKQITVNYKISKFIYPSALASVIAGFWQSKSFNETMKRVLGNYQPYTINEFPVYWAITLSVMMALLYIFGGRIYKWDLHLVYGKIMKKLARLLKEMEQLRTT